MLSSKGNSAFPTCLISSILLLLLSFISIAALAQDSDSAERSQMTTNSEITRVNDELKALTESLQLLDGEQLEVTQFHIFNKNRELRELLVRELRKGTLAGQTAVELVRQQQRFTEEAEQYLLERLAELNNHFNAESDEGKLLLLKDYKEAQDNLGWVYDASLTNFQWLEQLEVADEAGQVRFRDTIEQQLKLASAATDYYGNQSKSTPFQLLTTPESEQNQQQLHDIVIEKRLAIESEGLRYLIIIADSLDIETSSYKKQLFDISGDITQEILDGKVLFEILVHWFDLVIDWLSEQAPQQLFKLVVFLIVLLVTRSAVKLVRNIVGRAVKSQNLNLSHLMQHFFVSVSGNAVWTLGILIGLSQVGLNLAPILTGFGIAGVIVGFALQDTLSNFAAGMMLLIYRPFDVGDFVFAGGVDGKVSHMSLVSTTIRTFDNQVIIVPNGKIWGDVIKNVTHEKSRRVDMVFGIGYGDDLNHAESVLNDIVRSHPAVHSTPEPVVKVHTLNTSSVDFIVRPWVNTDDYWDVYWDITKQVKLRFDEEGISIPFPQQDIHLHTVSE
ncbi:mechanosensitive ion channel family protein [Vibrio hangzhouensis]|uniref:mechanosensitive ion channel family protein n=1 Tax=Vibrio hangzhouensis TaxID=462991 RepID=UPI001C984CC9|nr:mechanosensitive ion channel family protein [Vibrio hangzhouensis]MBY6195932.1 mechanosensitive ion channel family protein [Vibrio hangzhouensis]